MSAPKANKALGQHFLHARTIIEKITQDFSDQAKCIVEIGPGPGALTSKLCHLELPLYLIEKDERFAPQLIEWVGEDHFCLSDALAIEWEAYLEKFPSPLWLVSNLPYNIAAPLMVRLFAQEKIEFMTLMMQKEMGIKLCPPPGTKNCAGSLWALGQTFFEITKLTAVPASAFHPPPKVESLVLSFKRRPAPGITVGEYSTYETFLRRLFSERRKQIQKVLRAHYPQDTLLQALDQAAIEPTQRAESLDLNKIQKLYKILR